MLPPRFGLSVAAPPLGVLLDGLLPQPASASAPKPAPAAPACISCRRLSPRLPVLLQYASSLTVRLLARSSQTHSSSVSQRLAYYVRRTTPIRQTKRNPRVTRPTGFLSVGTG